MKILRSIQPDDPRVGGCLRAVGVSVAAAILSVYIGANMMVGLVTGAGGNAAPVLVVVSAIAWLGVGVGIFVAASAWRRGAQAGSTNGRSALQPGPTPAQGCLLAVAVAIGGAVLSFDLVVVSVAVNESMGLSVRADVALAVLSVPALAGIGLGVYIVASAWEGGAQSGR